MRAIGFARLSGQKSAQPADQVLVRGGILAEHCGLCAFVGRAECEVFSIHARSASRLFVVAPRAGRSREAMQGEPHFFRRGAFFFLAALASRSFCLRTLSGCSGSGIGALLPNILTAWCSTSWWSGPGWGGFGRSIGHCLRGFAGLRVRLTGLLLADGFLDLLGDAMQDVFAEGRCELVRVCARMSSRYLTWWPALAAASSERETAARGGAAVPLLRAGALRDGWCCVRVKLRGIRASRRGFKGDGVARVGGKVPVSDPFPLASGIGQPSATLSGVASI